MFEVVQSSYIELWPTHDVLSAGMTVVSSVDDDITCLLTAVRVKGGVSTSTTTAQIQSI